MMKGQQRLPLDEGFGHNIGRSQLSLFPDNVGRSAPESPQPPSPGVAPKVHPGQFQAFMTPREIRSRYQALDGDRETVYDERAGEMTRRPETTAGQANIVANTALRSRWAGWHGGASQIKGYNYARSESDEVEESDDQLFARKLNESQMSPGEYHEAHHGGEPAAPGWDTLEQRASAPRFRSGGGGSGSSAYESWHMKMASYADRKVSEHYDDMAYGPSLHDRIRAEGVKSPIHLSYAQMGSYGKPSIVGGHHRVAAQEDINPDQPIPVSHWRDIREAKSSKMYS